MIKILFVCYGNICRSPMAEFVLKDMVRKKNRQAEFEIASAAVSDDALGCDMHRGSKQKLTEEGIPFSPRQARRMCPEDYDRYDWIVAMDRSNIADIERITGEIRKTRCVCCWILPENTEILRTPGTPEILTPLMRTSKEAVRLFAIVYEDHHISRKGNDGCCGVSGVHRKSNLLEQNRAAAALFKKP